MYERQTSIHFKATFISQTRPQIQHWLAIWGVKGGQSLKREEVVLGLGQFGPMVGTRFVRKKVTLRCLT